MGGARYHPDALDRRDPALIRRLLPVGEWLAAHYFHVRHELAAAARVQTLMQGALDELRDAA